MKIDKKAFCARRTVRELWEYVKAVERHARSDLALFEVANRRKGLYEKYFQELRPFAHYCRLKYGLDSPFVCYLSDSEVGDAWVEDLSTGLKRLIEITWPQDPEHMKKLKAPRSKGGVIDFCCFDWDDTSLHKAAIERLLKVASKKSVRDYSNTGGSTLLFVFDKSKLFWDDNRRHQSVLMSMLDQLAEIPFHADEVEVMFLFGSKAELVPVRKQ